MNSAERRQKRRITFPVPGLAGARNREDVMRQQP